MRKVDVYGATGALLVFIDGKETAGVDEVIPPSREGFGQVWLRVDGPITYHGDVKPPQDTPAPMPYDWGRDYQRLVERLTVLQQKGKITMQDYGELLKGLSPI